jgi:hypothetical protein
VRRSALTGSAVNGRSDSERSGTALLWGDRDLAATLHAAGIPVAAVAGRSNTIRYSRYARDWVGDPDSGQDALVETLLRYATSQMEPVVLYYQTDDALLMLSRRRQELSAGFRFVLAEPDLVENSWIRRLFLNWPLVWTYRLHKLWFLQSLTRHEKLSSWTGLLWSNRFAVRGPGKETVRQKPFW